MKISTLIVLWAFIAAGHAWAQGSCVSSNATTKTIPIDVTLRENGQTAHYVTNLTASLWRTVCDVHAGALARQHPRGPGAPVPPIEPAGEGFLGLNKAKFHESFAADVPSAKADFMANSQLPWGVNALNGAVSEPAWRTKPSWYLVATSDRMIPPPAQQAMSKRAGSTVVEAAGSHSVYISKPKEVAALIEKAAKSVQ